ncbi:ABC transporter permease [Streptomyces sp. NBC_01716]|uniref:ABC transporter permease n=1 Tax=Streptomyces sp. NBC_01716 TaxID=2975917 RepID=UPI002E31A3E7|nr:ABC transporter permease [Streptomyces sp. NBC_01716]
MTATSRVPATPPAESAAGILKKPQVILPSTKRRRTRAGNVLAVTGPPALVGAAAIGIWYLLAYFGLSRSQRFILPPPHEVVKVGFLDWINLREILQGLLSSGTVALVAFALSTVIGLVFAIAMSEARWIERSFYPFAVALQTIPFLALVPLIGFWFGFNEQSRIIVATLVSLFPITTNALFGLQSGDAALHDLVRLHNRSRLVRLVRLRLPGARPAIFTGLRISAGLSVIASIVTDFFIRQGQPGIGGLLQNYSANLQSERLYAALIVTCTFGLAVFWAVGLVRRLTIGRWETSTATRSDD